MANEKDIKIKIVLNDGGTSATLKNINDQIISSKIPIQDLRKELGNFVVHSKKVQNAVNINRKQFNTLGKSVGGFTSQAGAATSATLEFGRVLSDAPYGIRGVANNLQQLASNLFFMSKGVDSATGKTIGFGGAVGNLLKGLAGPAGILIAFQGVVALLDYFKVGMDKASASASDFESSLTSLRRTLDDLGLSQEDINQKIEDYIILQDLKNKLDKSQEESSERLLDIEEDLISLREDNAKKQKKLLLDMTVAEYEALSDEEKAAHRRETLSVDFDKKFKQLKKNIKEEASLEKEKREIIKGSLEIQKEYNASKKLFNAADEESLQGLKNSKKEKEKERELLSKTSQDYKRLTIVIDEYQKKIEAIEGVKGAKTKIFDMPDFDKESENYISKIMSVEQKIAMLKVKDKASKLILQRDFHLKELKQQHKFNKDEYNEDYKASKRKIKLKLDEAVKLNKITQAQADNQLANMDRRNTSELIKTESNFSVLLQSYKNFYDARIKAENEASIASSDIDLKPPRTEGADKYSIAAARLKKASETYIEVQSSLTSFMSGEFDRQLTIEQNKTNALNNELNQRLLNENLSKDERERIQLQIGQNDEKLRKKQEQIEKKRFRMNKAANIAGALVNTAAAAAGVMAEAKGGFFARLSQALPTIAFGLAQVATIARTKFQSSAGSGGSIGPAAGSNGGGEGDREFNFNLAGSTQSNQLTQSIAGQLSQPIQTYVVSSEITSQQQLDLNISNTATIG